MKRAKRPEARKTPRGKTPRGKRPEALKTPRGKTPRRTAAVSPGNIHDDTDARHDFASPISWTLSPEQSVDAREAARLFKYGDLMCRGDIDEDYIRHLLHNDPTVSYWFIRDAKGHSLGFAITTVEAALITLHLICTLKRKGEAMRLFRDILRYAVRTQRTLTLDAITQTVAKKYAQAALDEGMHVYAFNRSVASVADVPDDTDIIMLFRP